MAAHRYVKPFIVAGLTGALSLGAPISALAEGVAADLPLLETTTTSNVETEALVSTEETLSEQDSAASPEGGVEQLAVDEREDGETGADDAAAVETADGVMAPDTLATDSAPTTALASTTDDSGTAVLTETAQQVAARASIRYELQGLSGWNSSNVLFSGTYWDVKMGNPYIFRVVDLATDDHAVVEGVTFTSSNPSVLEVGADGTWARTNATGAATVTATYNGEEIGSISYSVIEYTGDHEDSAMTENGYTFSTWTSMNGSVTEPEIWLGTTTPFDIWTLSPVDQYGNPTQDTVDPSLVTFESDNPEVLFVNEEDGCVEPRKPGKATLTATVHDEQGKELGSASIVYTVPEYESLIETASVGVWGETAGVKPLYSNSDYSLVGVMCDLSNGTGYFNVGTFISPAIDDEASNVKYLGQTVTSDNESVARVAYSEYYGTERVEIVGPGTATISVVLNYTVGGEARTTTKTFAVEASGELPDPEGPQDPQDPQNPQDPQSPSGETGNTGNQPSNEQKPQDTTDKKDKSDGEGLPETGDPAFVAMGIAGLAGVGAVAAGMRSRRRED